MIKFYCVYLIIIFAMLFLSYIFYFVIGIHFGRNLDSMKNYINNANDNIVYFLLILSNIFIYLIRIKGMETPGI